MILTVKRSFYVSLFMTSLELMTSLPISLPEKVNCRVLEIKRRSSSMPLSSFLLAEKVAKTLFFGNVLLFNHLTMD